jgi:hypothetical protein
MPTEIAGVDNEDLAYCSACSDVHGVFMAIWPTTGQQPGQRICQQILLEDNQDLACWSVHAKPALALKCYGGQASDYVIFCALAVACTARS